MKQEKTIPKYTQEDMKEAETEFKIKVGKKEVEVYISGELVDTITREKYIKMMCR